MSSTPLPPSDLPADQPAAPEVPAAPAVSAEAGPATPDAPAPAAEPSGMSPADCAAELKQRFPALFGGEPKPLKLRIQTDIQERAPGVFTKTALSGFFRRYTHATAYLIAVTKAQSRFDLDGNPAGELSEEHRQIAETELARRRAIVKERREAEAQARRERAQLLADVEAGKVTTEAYCAEKGMTAEAFEALLVQARKEAAEPKPEPRARGPRPGQGPRRDRGDRADRGGEQRPRGPRAERAPRDGAAAAPADGAQSPARAERGDRPPRADRPQGDRPRGDRPSDRGPRRADGEQRPRGERADGRRTDRQDRQDRPRHEGAPRRDHPADANAPKSALALALEAAKAKSGGKA